MQYENPYLFLAYEFKKYSEASKVIIIIGYSFSDDHINKILIESLREKPGKTIIFVSPCNNIEENKKETEIKEKLKIDDIDEQTNTIKVIRSGAKDFLENILKKSFIIDYLPSEDLPF